jgi:hypothetical protein
MVFNYSDCASVKPNMENSMSLKSNKSNRVTFCDLDAIELDSLEPQIQINGDEKEESDVDCDNKSDSVSFSDDFDDDELDKFIEFDVSFVF